MCRLAGLAAFTALLPSVQALDAFKGAGRATRARFRATRRATTRFQKYRRGPGRLRA
jgi:hypothetical protein